MSRLISVDELKEWVKNWFDVNRNYHPYSKQNNIPIPELYDILERMPTIEERKTGRWIRGDQEKLTGSQRCSYCGKTAYKGRDYFDYCPNCGARMER